jgi:type III secretion protein F
VGSPVSKLAHRNQIKGTEMSESLSRNSVSETIGPLLEKTDGKMRELMAQMKNGELSSGQLLQLQSEVQNLSVLTQLQAQLVKTLGDILKDIVSKTS